MKILYCERELPVATGLREDVEKPRVTMFVDSSLSRNRMPLFLPPHHRWECVTLAPAVRISRLGKYIAPRFARRYYDAIGLVARLRPCGEESPSAVDAAFDSSIVVGEWIKLDDGSEWPEQLTLAIGDGVTSREVTLPLSQRVVDDTLSGLSEYFTVKTGDVIVPGDTDIKFDPIIDTRVVVALDGIECLRFKIK